MQNTGVPRPKGGGRELEDARALIRWELMEGFWEGETEWRSLKNLDPLRAHNGVPSPKIIRTMKTGGVPHNRPNFP